jgi:hypothetical protein
MSGNIDKISKIYHGAIGLYEGGSSIRGRFISLICVVVNTCVSYIDSNFGDGSGCV